RSKTSNTANTIKNTCSSVCCIRPCNVGSGTICRARCQQRNLCTDCFCNSSGHPAAHMVTVDALIVGDRYTFDAFILIWQFSSAERLVIQWQKLHRAVDISEDLIYTFLERIPRFVKI